MARTQYQKRAYPVLVPDVTDPAPPLSWLGSAPAQVVSRRPSAANLTPAYAFVPVVAAAPAAPTVLSPVAPVQAAARRTNASNLSEVVEPVGLGLAMVAWSYPDTIPQRIGLSHNTRQRFSIVQPILVPDVTQPVVPLSWKPAGPVSVPAARRSVAGVQSLAWHPSTPSAGAPVALDWLPTYPTAAPGRRALVRSSYVLAIQAAQTYLLTLTGATSPSGTLSTTKVSLLSVTGTTSPSGVLIRRTSKLLAGGTSPAGSLAKQGSKALSGVIAPAGALVKRVGKLLAGVTSPGGILLAAKVALLTLAGAMSPSGALVRQLGKTLTGATSPSGALGRRVAKLLTGVMSPDGVLIKLTRTTLSGVLGLSGALVAGIGGLFPPLAKPFRAVYLQARRTVSMLRRRTQSRN